MDLASQFPGIAALNAAAFLPPQSKESLASNNLSVESSPLFLKQTLFVRHTHTHNHGSSHYPQDLQGWMPI